MDFDKMGKTVTDAAKVAGKKAEGLANSAKIRFALANLQSDLDDLYEKLGKMHYEELSGNAVSQNKKEKIIAKIDSVRTDMEILKGELIRTKSGRICGECKRNVPKNISFCPYCGKKFD